jgi:fucose permease
MTSVLAQGLPWQRGYAIVAVAQVVLAAAFAATLRQWGVAPRPMDGEPAPAAARLRETARHPVARLASATFLLYTGLEASLGVWAYSWLTMGRGISMVAAGSAVSIFWGGLTAGRLLAAIGGGGVAPAALLRACVAGVAVCAGLLVIVPAMAAIPLLGLAGVALGPIYPLLVATTPERVGPAHVSNAVGFQVAAAAVGQFLLPGFVGLLAERLGVGLIPSLCAVFAVLLVGFERALTRTADTRSDHHSR